MPGIPLPSSEGRLMTVLTADPAANAEISQTVNTGLAWWLIGASVQLVQGATQTPLPALVIDDGTNIIGQFPGSTAALPASSTGQFSWGTGVPTSAIIGSGANCSAIGAISDNLILPSGYRIRTVTTGLGANSNYGVMTLFICQIG